MAVVQGDEEQDEEWRRADQQGGSDCLSRELSIKAWKCKNILFCFVAGNKEILDEWGFERDFYLFRVSPTFYIPRIKMASLKIIFKAYQKKFVLKS